MGSSQSQPTRRPERSSTTTEPLPSSTNNPLPSRPTLASSSSRFSTLRRLSSYATNPKRSRPGSVVSERKKPRVTTPPIETDTDRDDYADTTPTTSSAPLSTLPSSSSSRIRLDDEELGETPRESIRDKGKGRVFDTPSLPTSPGPPITSIIPDPLRLERSRSIASIRSVHGAGWEPPGSPPEISSPAPLPDPTSSLNPHTIERPNRQRRSSLPERGIRGLTGQLTALLGLSSPAREEPTTTSQSHAQSPSISDLTENIEAVRNDLDRTRRDIDETLRELRELQNEGREEGPILPPPTPVPARTSNNRPETPPVRTGAVLIIQGLAQTRVSPDEPASTGEGETGNQTRPRHTRRSSDGNILQRRNRNRVDDTPSIEAQARMIGGLLTVAAAATASSLISLSSSRSTPEPTPTPPSRSSNIASSVLESIMNRLRPNRASRAAETIERALSNYLRDAAAQDERSSSSTSNDGIRPAVSDSGVPLASGEFQRFLEILQMDLVSAVREFAEPGNSDDGASETTSVVSTTSTASYETAPSPTVATTPRDTTFAEAQTSSSANNPDVPSYHYQPGQNLPSTHQPRISSVSGGSNGRPRRLNFFRAHVFAPSTTAEEDPNAVVPCVFIGVRSIVNHPELTTDGPVNHPTFAFSDESDTAPPATSPLRENPPPSSPAMTSPSSTPATSATPAATETQPRRSLRTRFLDRINNRQRSPSPSTRSMHTYLVFVIGGNYPRNHPVLRIPNLLTGGPLTDEELSLVGELMGEVKPPTANPEDLEKSGLRVVDGGEIGGLVDEGKVLDSCAERCLICLSDFEAGEQCRILSCRHGFHKDCVDQWLCQGRNNCPACRSEAVQKPQLPSAHTPASTSASPNTSTNSASVIPNSTDMPIALEPDTETEAGPSSS